MFSRSHLRGLSHRAAVSPCLFPRPNRGGVPQALGSAAQDPVAAFRFVAQIRVGAGVTKPGAIESPPAVLVSIIVATKNDRVNLSRLIKQAQASTLGATEIIIVDGRSADGTQDMLMALDSWEPPSIHWSSAPDNGIAQAWNRGVLSARGEWIVFLGADDRIYDRDAWQGTMQALSTLPASCGLALAPVAVVSPIGRLLAIESPPSRPILERCLAQTPLAHQGLFHRRGLWAALGSFDTALKIAADYEFCLRAFRAGAICEPLAVDPPVAMTFGGWSKRNPLATLREIRRVQRRYDVRLPASVRTFQWLRSCLKWCGLKCLPSSTAAWWADVFRRMRGLPAVWTVR